MFPWYLCQICDNYMFPEGDEDGFCIDDCKNPSVITIFGNFHRKNKCKYYKKVSYEKFLKETRRRLSWLTNFNFYYRDSKYRRKMRKYHIDRIKTDIELYLEFRDFLFNKLGELT